MTEYEMTPKKAAELRKPFPASVIGKLPRGGTTLDYCGHAAVTDRLLAVDPFWNWEPLTVDEAGLPALDRKGNLWIRLTVCGVTRIGVGDGSSAKECIGDAIRNAAMRFGVALDLWSKDELEQTSTGAAKLRADLNSAPVTAADLTGCVVIGQTWHLMCAMGPGFWLVIAAAIVLAFYVERNSPDEPRRVVPGDGADHPHPFTGDTWTIRKWRWRFVATNGRILADTGQGYTRRIDCLKGCASVLGAAFYKSHQRLIGGSELCANIPVHDLTRTTNQQETP